MVQAPVGWQCPQCVAEGAKKSPVLHYQPNRGGTLGATNPTPVVIALIVVNVVCFVASGFGRNSVLDRFGLWPNGIRYENEWYRFFTAMFLHVSIEHIFLNMITLLILGPAVEIILGKWRFLALYLLAGLGGGVASYLLSPMAVVGVGASGAIFGVLGAYLILAIRNHFDLTRVIGLIAINVVFGFVDRQIDWRAHFGGFFIGAALAFGLSVALEQRTRSARLWGSVAVCCVAAVVLAAVGYVVPPGHVNWT